MPADAVDPHDTPHTWTAVYFLLTEARPTTTWCQLGAALNLFQLLHQTQCSASILLQASGIWWQSVIFALFVQP